MTELFGCISDARGRIQNLRSTVNLAWEQWSSTDIAGDPDFSSLDEAFSAAQDKITDALEKLFDLAADPQKSEQECERAAAGIIDQSATEAASVLQRVVSWYLKGINAKIKRWSVSLFLPIEDIDEEYARLNSEFAAASKSHEDNRFEDAVASYFRLATSALNLLSKIRRRPILHPQRRLFLLAAALAIFLFLVNLTLTLYFNLWRR